MCLKTVRSLCTSLPVMALSILRSFVLPGPVLGINPVASSEGLKLILAHLMLTTGLKKNFTILLEDKKKISISQWGLFPAKMTGQVCIKLFNSCGVGALAFCAMAGRSQARVCGILGFLFVCFHGSGIS